MEGYPTGAADREQLASNAEWMGHSFCGGDQMSRLYGQIIPERLDGGAYWRAVAVEAGGMKMPVGIFEDATDARDAVEACYEPAEPSIVDGLRAAGQGAPVEMLRDPSEFPSVLNKSTGELEILRAHAHERPALDPAGVTADVDRGLVLVGVAASLTVDAARDLVAALRAAVDGLILPAPGWAWELGKEWVTTIDGKRRAYLNTPDFRAQSTTDAPAPGPINVGYVEFTVETGRYSAFDSITHPDTGEVVEIADVGSFGDAQLNLAAYFRSKIADGTFPAGIATSSDNAGQIATSGDAAAESDNAG